MFRRHVGQSPLKYQRELRMRLACKMLTDPYRSIKQVARACGYDDTSYFVRVFRNQIGQSPGRWRSRRAKE